MPELGIKRTLVIAGALSCFILVAGYAYIASQVSSSGPIPVDDVRVNGEEEAIAQILEVTERQLPVSITNNAQYTRMRYDEDSQSFIMTFEVVEDNIDNELEAISISTRRNTQISDNEDFAERCENRQQMTLGGKNTVVEFVEPGSREAYRLMDTLDILCYVSVDVNEGMTRPDLGSE